MEITLTINNDGPDHREYSIDIGEMPPDKASELLKKFIEEINDEK